MSLLLLSSFRCKISTLIGINCFGPAWCFYHFIMNCSLVSNTLALFVLGKLERFTALCKQQAFQFLGYDLNYTKSLVFHSWTSDQPLHSPDGFFNLESYRWRYFVTQGGSSGRSHKHSRVSLCLKSGYLEFGLHCLLSHHSYGLAKNTCHKWRWSP